MVTETIPQSKSLSLAKMRLLISELLAEVYGKPVRDREVAGALSARLKHYRENPRTAKSWPEVRARLRKNS